MVTVEQASVIALSYGKRSMRISSSRHLCALPRNKTFRLSASIFALTFAAILVAGQQPQPHKAAAPANGLAWLVKGEWQENGKGASLKSGDVIHPGSLLQPADLNVIHSITVLMPDGRRFFYECFTPEDCSRGFRVPVLTRQPLPLAVDLIERVRAGLTFEAKAGLPDAKTPQPSPLPRDEFVAAIDADHQVHVAGLAKKMANGHFVYDLRSLDHAYPRRFRISLQKTGPSIAIAVPSPGLYIATITDDLNVRRIDLFIAAVDAAHAPRYQKLFSNVGNLLKDWNGDFQGWPIHELQRAYLESLIENIKPSPPVGITNQYSSINLPSFNDAPARTAEPIFSPKVGLMKGDTAIKLDCATPGCTIRYTVDGSQPVAISPVYAAPIILMGTELTIKAYASSPGKKDSPIITGVYLIEGADPN